MGELDDPFGLAGTVLEGQYRVDEVVGEGGFGVVYRGYHLAFEQPIAIKALKVPALDPKAQQAILAQFREEAKILFVLSQASLDIVRAIDFGAIVTPRGPWAPFVVLEWLEGRSLAQDLATRRAACLEGRTLNEAMTLLEPAVRGLIAAHRKRIAHRDVKPANVFLTKTNEDPPKPTTKMLDFGIAKAVSAEGDAARTAGFSSFTPYYAAPEQLDRSLGPTGLHTDVYSFALLMVEVLTDRPPTDAQEMVQVIQVATDRTKRPTPHSRGLAIPEVVESVFARALAVDPKARHGDMEQLWAALCKARDAAAPTGTVAIPSKARPRVGVAAQTQPIPASMKSGPRLPLAAAATPQPGSVPRFIPPATGSAPGFGVVTPPGVRAWQPPPSPPAHAQWTPPRVEPPPPRMEPLPPSEGPRAPTHGRTLAWIFLALALITLGGFIAIALHERYQ